MSALDSKDIDGRALKVNEARPKTDRGGGGGGGGRGGPPPQKPLVVLFAANQLPGNDSN